MFVQLPLVVKGGRVTLETQNGHIFTAPELQLPLGRPWSARSG